MVTRRLKMQSWENVWHWLQTHAVSQPLSLQHDYKMRVDGDEYILRLQYEKGRRLTILQAIRTVFRDGTAVSTLVTQESVLQALLELAVAKAVEQCSTAFGRIIPGAKIPTKTFSF